MGARRPFGCPASRTGTVVPGRHYAPHVDPLPPSPAGPGASASPAVVVREWTSDAGFPGRASQALLRQLYFSGRMRAVLVGLAVAMVAVLVVSDGRATTLVLMTLCFGSVALIVRRQTRRQLARQVPEGTTFRGALGDDSLWLQGPLGSSWTAYAAYTDVVVRSDVIVLRHRHGNMHSALPAALFPGSDLDVLRERVAAARAVPARR